MASRFAQALEKGARAERLDRDEALALVGSITPQSLHAPGEAAHANRLSRFGREATFVFNMQINPTNICNIGCSFCDYAATRKEEHAYVLEEADILDRVGRLQPTEVHIVGGLNTIWPSNLA